MKDHYEESVVFQLKKRGIIDHATVSVYVRTDFDSGNSHVKFGSWDKSAIEGELYQIRTVGTTSWTIKAGRMSLVDGQYDVFNKDEVRYVDFDPSVPYIHLPS